jgi:hypothetical protein
MTPGVTGVTINHCTVISSDSLLRATMSNALWTAKLTSNLWIVLLGVMNALVTLAKELWTISQGSCSYPGQC